MIDVHPESRRADEAPRVQAESWPSVMTDALRAEADAARRLRELAERQGGFIAAGRIDTARALVAHRATLIEEIRGHQDRVRELAAAGADEGELEPAVAEELKDLQRSIRDDLRVVSERDAEDRVAITARRDQAQQELGRVSGGRKARQAYAGPAPVAPRFGDERG